MIPLRLRRRRVYCTCLHPNLLFCSKENERMDVSAVRILDRICWRSSRLLDPSRTVPFCLSYGRFAFHREISSVLPPRSWTLSCGAKEPIAGEWSTEAITSHSNPRPAILNQVLVLALGQSLLPSPRRRFGGGGSGPLQKITWFASSNTGRARGRISAGPHE
jgi:hypothetical protein